MSYDLPCHIVWNIFFSSFLRLPLIVFTQTTRAAKDSTHVTGTCQRTRSLAVIIIITDMISESADKSIMGSRLRLCRSKSVYSSTQTAISELKHTIDTTFTAHPDTIKTSIRISIMQLCMMTLVNWLMRLYSIMSG